MRADENVQGEWLMRKLVWSAVAAFALLGVAAADAQDTPRKGGIIRMTAPYAASFGKDADFYDFYRAMQSYRQTFAATTSSTNMILSKDNAYLKEFTGRGR